MVYVNVFTYFVYVNFFTELFYAEMANLNTSSASKLKWDIPTYSGNDTRSFDRWDNQVLSIISSLKGGKPLASFVFFKTGREQVKEDIAHSVRPQYLSGDAQLLALTAATKSAQHHLGDGEEGDADPDGAGDDHDADEAHEGEGEGEENEDNDDDGESVAASVAVSAQGGPTQGRTMTATGYG